jgi:hypothetical protein
MPGEGIGVRAFNHNIDVRANNFNKDKLRKQNANFKEK